MCTGAYRHTSSDRLLAELGWQSLRTRQLNHKRIQLFKMTHQISPPYLQSILPAAVKNRYNTRNSTNNSLPVIYAKLSSTEIHPYLHLLKSGIICLLVFVVQHHFIFLKVALLIWTKKLTCFTLTYTVFIFLVRLFITVGWDWGWAL